MHSIQVVSGEKLWETRKLELFGLVSRSTFYLWHKEATHAPHLILYIPHVACSKNAIYTFTSTRPVGSRVPSAVSAFRLKVECAAYLKLNLGLGNVCLAATSAGNLLGFGDLVPDSLLLISQCAVCRIMHSLTSALKSSNG